MLKKIFTLNYHPILIKILVESSLVGAFVANIIAPFIASFLLYKFIPHTVTHSILIANIFLFSFRIIVSKKLLYYINNQNTKKIRFFLTITFALIFLTSVQYIPILWISIFYHTPPLYILMLGVIIISLAAGAISTLSSVFTAFFIYVITTVVPLFCFALYIGGTVFDTFPFIIFVFSTIILSAGYRQFTILKNSIYLKETFETIFEKSSDGIIIIEDYKFIDCNEAILKMIKCESKDDFLKLNIEDLSPKYQPDGRMSDEKAKGMMQIALKEGSNNFEWLHKKSDDEEFWTEIVLTKIYLNDKTLLHAVVRDVNQKKEKDALLLELNSNLEEKIENAVKNIREKDELLKNQHSLAQMGEMLSMIAHQWRQPLSAVASTNSAISLKARLNKLDKNTALTLTEEISIYIKHLSDTIDDFRDFFKPEKGISITSYDELVENVSVIISSSLRDKKIELIKELKCKDKFNTYSNEIKQVILNLIKNAEDVLIENSIEKPFIKIKTYKKDKNVILEVSDNGGGIPKKIITKIFKPYFSTKTKKNGTGLGLYMSKKIVEDHCHGKLDVSNSSDGAVFKITLGDI